MNAIEMAIKFAVKCHSGQTDKDGQPYILHPLSVMFRVRRAGLCEAAQVAAILHDVVEDCGVSLDEISRRFGEQAASVVDAVTRRESETYEVFINRANEHPDGRSVKLADIEDNLDPSRHTWGSGVVGLERLSRLRERYDRARVILADAL